MPFSNQIPDAVFTNVVARVFPFQDEAAFFHVFGLDARQSCRNFAGGPAAAIVGAPTFDANAMNASPFNGINTGLVMSGSVTLAGLFNDAGTALFIGSVDSNSWVGSEMDGILRLGAGYAALVDGANRVTLTGGAPAAGVNFAAMTFDGARATIYGARAGEVSSLFANYSSGNINTKPIRIGGHASTTNFPTAFKAYAAIGIPRALGASEIGDLYAYFVDLGASRGLTVN